MPSNVVNVLPTKVNVAPTPSGPGCKYVTVAPVYVAKSLVVAKLAG